MQSSNFLCAALPSIVTHCDNVLKDHPHYLDNEKVNSFFKSNVDKFLTSIGVVLNKLPKDPTKREKVLEKGRMTTALIDKYVKMLDNMRGKEYLKDCEIVIDSGAFSLQVGYFDKSEIIPFIDLYNNEFLVKNYEKFKYAFLFDVAPGAVECPFDSFEELRDMADYSYNISSKLPQEVRDKCLYVHHFRTPKINNIYKDLLNKYGEKFNNFATGGLVSFSRAGKIPPYIMYIVPLLRVLDHVLERGIKSFRFHVLGGSEWKEILGHKFLERHIKEVFDVDVQITYDSSTLFKTLCMGRYTFFPDHKQKRLSKLSIRSALKDTYASTPGSDIIQNKTNEELFCQMINEVVVPHGMKALDVNEIPLYDIENNMVIDFDMNHEPPKGKLNRLVYTYGMLHLLNIFKVVEEWSTEFVDQTYYRFLKPMEFDNELNKEVEHIMGMFNGLENFKLSSVGFKSSTIHNTLELISSFKTNREKALKLTDRLVTLYMGGDECEKLKPELDKFQNQDTIDD